MALDDATKGMIDKTTTHHRSISYAYKLSKAKMSLINDK